MTKEDLNKIEKDAERHYSKIWKAVRYFQFWNKKPTDVLLVTPINELILIKGNDKVGFEHIRSRHIFWSSDIYTKNDNASFDNPSKMGVSINYQDIPKICDLIYSTENFAPEVNNNPEENDLYEGIVDGETYRLILYAGTKIIISLIPIKTHSKTSKLKNFKFTRGVVTVDSDDNDMKRIIYIPYLDLDFQVKYVARITKCKRTNIERWEIMIMDEPEISNIQYLLGDQELRWLKYKKSEQLHFQHDDSRKLDIEIKKLHTAITTGKFDIKKIIEEKSTNKEQNDFR